MFPKWTESQLPLVINIWVSLLSQVTVISIKVVLSRARPDVANVRPDIPLSSPVSHPSPRSFPTEHRGAIKPMAITRKTTDWIPRKKGKAVKVMVLAHAYRSVEKPHVPKSSLTINAFSLTVLTSLSLPQRIRELHSQAYWGLGSLCHGKCQKQRHRTGYKLSPEEIRDDVSLFNDPNTLLKGKWTSGNGRVF